MVEIGDIADFLSTLVPLEEYQRTAKFGINSPHKQLINKNLGLPQKSVFLQLFCRLRRRVADLARKLKAHLIVETPTLRHLNHEKFELSPNNQVNYLLRAISTTANESFNARLECLV